LQHTFVKQIKAFQYAWMASKSSAIYKATAQLFGAIVYVFVYEYRAHDMII
jgi:hypothetical protein